MSTTRTPIRAAADAPASRVTRWTLVRRALRLASVIARHGLGYLLERARVGWLVPFHRGLLGHTRRNQPFTAPEHVRMALEDLGPTFVKLTDPAIKTPRMR